MNELILVTGANGNTGSLLLDFLLKDGVKVRAAVRDLPQKNAKDHVDYRLFNFTDSSSWEACLENVDKIFLLRPPQMSNIKKDMLPFLKFVKKKGISQILFLSVQGAETNRMIPHHKVEQYCQSLNLPYTFLRPSFFMQNLSTTHLSEIRDEKRVYVPSGEGKTNFIDLRDVAEIAAILLRNNEFIGKAYTITGAQSFSHREIALALSEGLNETIEFVSPSPIPFIVHHLKRGTALPMALVMLALYTIVRIGKGDISTKDSEMILGRQPRSLEDFIRDHKDLLKRNSN